MAEVNGTLGNEYIELNNAATEATLKQLLAATMLANKQSVDQVNKMAQKMGLDPTAVAAANKGLTGISASSTQGQSSLKSLSKASDVAAGAFSLINERSLEFVNQLTKGGVGLDQFLSPLEKLPGALGTFGMLLVQTAKYQQDNLREYEKITQIGANFGGSLTDLRQAALNSYMSLAEFGTFLKSNGDALSKMGGSVNDGAKAFSRLSKDLISSEVGTRLMSLGYSTDQINQSMANYITSTGGRTRQEMQNTQALAQATSLYLTELDALTQFTGTSKEALEEEAKKAAQNAAFQRKLASLDEGERVKLKAAYDKAAASGIEGATDLVISTSLGLPPVTKAAQTLSGVAPKVATGFNNMTKTAMDTTKTMKDVNKEYGNTLLEGKAASRQFEQVGDAIATTGGEYGKVMNGLIGVENKLRAQGIENEEEFSQRQEEIRKNIEEQQKSQATNMAKSNKAIAEIAQVINNMLGPAVNFLTGVFAKLLEHVSTAVKFFDSLATEVKLLAGAITVLLLLYKRKEIAEKAKSVAEAAKGKLAVPGATAANPLYVMIVGRAPGGGGAGGGGAPSGPETSPDTDKDKGKGGKKGGGLGNKMKFGLGGLLGGVALDVASEQAAKSGNENLSKGLDIGSYAASGAGMGAFLGPKGAIIGGLLGAGYGAYQNFFNGPPKMEKGGIVTQPTTVVAGEAGPEGIIPLHHLESLKTELQRLNNQSAEMIRHLRDNVDYSKRTVDAINASSGDLFKF
jgi:hypothetical protein